MIPIQNISAGGGGGLGPDQAIFSLLNQSLTFTNLSCTISDSRIKATDAIIVYYSDASVAAAANIDCTWTDGSVTFTVSQNPSSALTANIYDIKPSLANVWDQISANEVSYNAGTVKDALDSILIGNVALLNGYYRGYTYPTTITSAAQFQEWRSFTGLADGSFSNIRLGDSFTINDGTVTSTWIVAGFNTELNKGNNNVLDSIHVALISTVPYANSKMSNSDSTAGGYKSSVVWSTLDTIASRLTAIMSTNLVTRDILITNSVNASAASAAGAGYIGSSDGWEWKSTKCTLMTEVQVFGATVFSSSAFDTGEGYEKLPVFNFINPVHFGRTSWWLRSVCSSVGYALVNGGGNAAADGASASVGVRPLIIIN